MPDVIFARPRHTYDSYTDFWRLVEVSGYPVIFIDEIDATSDHTYILSTPDTRWHDGTYGSGWPDARARIIYYNLEWYTDVEYARIPGLAEVWSPDQWWADRFHMRYVPLGSDSRLRCDNRNVMDKDYDCITLWAASGHRYAGMAQLTSRPIRVAPNGWGEARHFALIQSRCMVHVHQWADKPTVAPQRFALAAAYALPLITETIAEWGIFTPDYRLMCPLDEIGVVVENWSKRENWQHLQAYGDSLHDLLCVQHSFRKQIEAHV